MSAPCRGTALRTHRVKVRLVRQGKPGRTAGSSKPSDRIPEIRKMLRTDMPTDAIADAMGVCRLTLKNFIKRRNICNLTDRRNFLSMKRSLARLDEKSCQRSSDVEQPHCRRTRADSSPAAGTNSNFEREGC